MPPETVVALVFVALLLGALCSAPMDGNVRVGVWAAILFLAACYLLALIFPSLRAVLNR